MPPTNCDRYSSERLLPFRRVENFTLFHWSPNETSPIYTGILPLPQWVIPRQDLHPVSTEMVECGIGIAGVCLKVIVNSLVQGPDVRVKVRAFPSMGDGGVLLANLFPDFEGVGCDSSADTRFVSFSADWWNQNIHADLGDQDLLIQANITGQSDPHVCQPDGPWITLSLSWIYLESESEELLDLMLWDEDLCQNIVYAEGVRPVEHFDIPPLAPWTSPNNFELISLHPNRITKEPPADKGDPCVFSYATLVIDKEGYEVGMVCTDHDDPGALSGPYTNIALPFVRDDSSGPYVEGDNIGKLIPEGYFGYIAGVEAPRYYELVVQSQAHVCIGVPE